MADEPNPDNPMRRREPSGERPDWWDQNELIRESLGIAGIGPYQPPRFTDGVYAYRVKRSLESEYGCSIRIVSFNPDRDGAWEVRVDGETIESIHRRRTESGNSIYEISSDDFRDAVERAIAG